MRASAVVRGCLLSALVASSTVAMADLWGDIGRTILAPVTLPAETTIKIIQRDDPTEPVRNAAGAVGRVATAGADVVDNLQNRINQIPRDVIAQDLGGDWVSAFDALTASERVQQQMALTSGRFLGGCLQSRPCTINQVVALPVAAELRDSYNIYIGQSQSLPPNVQALLIRVVPENIVRSARVVTADIPNFTFPGFMNAGYSAAGSGHAVTIGNLIIFSRHLNNEYGDWEWLLHELHHIEQYAAKSPSLGESIDGFAVDYVQYPANMEEEARQVAAQRVQALARTCQYGC